MVVKKGKKINCFDCERFYITWDREFPYGCKGFAMKSRRLPSLDVMANSGKPCLLFEKKAHKDR